MRRTDLTKGLDDLTVMKLSTLEPRHALPGGQVEPSESWRDATQGGWRHLYGAYQVLVRHHYHCVLSAEVGCTPMDFGWPLRNWQTLWWPSGDGASGPRRKVDGEPIGKLRLAFSRTLNTSLFGDSVATLRGPIIRVVTFHAYQNGCLF